LKELRIIGANDGTGSEDVVDMVDDRGAGLVGKFGDGFESHGGGDGRNFEKGREAGEVGNGG
jgi:hypothetical protein